ncbi:carbon-nitrogen hydrolase family protein [Anaerosalibacter bizertensis]|uniref:carbon-nitrogen hydrolase family protein n=1 Tax=Anaerosalibacter bizertensis TaxID=932217 RepID=UPI001C0F3794|nr:carbon-nitrogen hydrolase family protein [Anaerosalibacter bizertensis]MBU5294377.1 carbon-nitrogen hydrolase family protein [Anaerosalibacter bizertensis]
MKEHIAACVQISIEPNNIEQNIEKASEWLIKAKKEHEAELVVFPEDITTGTSPNMPIEEFYEMLEPIPGNHTEPIQKLAKDLGVHVVFPLYERGREKNTIYNSSVLIDDKGEILANYRKTHPFPSEREWTTPGNKVVVADTKLGKIGMIICYDGDFPELSRICALKGAEIITRPSALMRSFEIWELTNKARAYDNHVYLLGANSVGADADGNYFFGSSMIVNPIGQTIALARAGDDIISAKLNPDPLKYISYGSKAPMTFDHLEDRNTEVYKGILAEGKSSFEPSIRIPYKK